MSLLPATSHANPDTPFWSAAGTGGGGYVGGRGIDITGNVVSSTVEAGLGIVVGLPATDNPLPIAALSAVHLSLSANTTQTVTGTNTAKIIVFDTVESSVGTISWTPTIPTEIITQDSGTYRFIYSVQLNSSAGNKAAYIYLRKNKSALARTNSVSAVTHSHQMIMTAEFIIQADAGDVFELVLLSPDDVGMMIENIPGGGTTPNDYPSSPSCVFTVQRII